MLTLQKSSAEPVNLRRSVRAVCVSALLLLVASEALAVNRYFFQRDKDKEEAQEQREKPPQTPALQAVPVSAGEAKLGADNPELPMAKTWPVDDGTGRGEASAGTGLRWEAVPTADQAAPSTEANQSEQSAGEQRFRLDQDGFLVPVSGSDPQPAQIERGEPVFSNAADQAPSPQQAPAAVIEPRVPAVAEPAAEVIQPGAPAAQPPVQRGSLFVAPRAEEQQRAKESPLPITTNTPATEPGPDRGRYPTMQVPTDENLVVEPPMDNYVPPQDVEVLSAEPVRLSSFGSANLDTYALIKARLEASRPDVVVRRVSGSPLPGMYQVEFQGGLVAYVNDDASFFVLGDLFQVDAQQGFVNLGEQLRRERRGQELASLTPDETINYLSMTADYRGKLFVFTDADCTQCRRLHQDVPKLAEMGIEVRYLAWPRNYSRSGTRDASFNALAKVWCAEEREAALDDMRSTDVEGVVCAANPVAEHAALGTRVGVKTAPTIVTEGGRMVTGYHSPEQLQALLKRDQALLP